MTPNNHQPDELDHILATINATSAPSGLESRIHARLAQQESTPAGPRALFFRPRFILPFAAAATAALVAAVALHRPAPPSHTGCDTAPCLATSASNPPRPAAPATPASLPASAPSQLASTAFRLAPAAISSLHAPSSAAAAPVSDTTEASFPAPEAPLTAQERLLLRAARHDSPTQLAELDPLRQLAAREYVQAHQQSTVAQYLRHALAPLAFAERVSPTSPQPEPPTESPTDTAGSSTQPETSQPAATQPAATQPAAPETSQQ